MKKKVFIMVNSLNVGGAEKSLSSLLSLLDYEKYEVFLQMINYGGSFEPLIPAEVIILPGIDFFEFCKIGLKRQLLSGKFRYLKTRLNVALSIKLNKSKHQSLHDTQAFWKGGSGAFEKCEEYYDIAIAWGQGTPTHYIAEKIQAIKKIAWINADYEAAGHNRSFDLKIYEKYTNLVAVSDKLAESLKRVFPEYSKKILTIYDINSSELVKKMSEESALFPTLHGTVISTVGRLEKAKGYDISVEAARILFEQGIDFTWLICGEGTERAKIEECIKKYGLENHYILLGNQINPYPYIQKSEIYVQTSRFEGYCLTLTEARILNRPCVTTRFDVVFDQMVDGENGLVVDMNAEAVAEGIIRLINDNVLYQHIYDYQCKEKKGNIEELSKVYDIL